MCNFPKKKFDDIYTVLLHILPLRGGGIALVHKFTGNVHLKTIFITSDGITSNGKKERNRGNTFKD